MLSPFQFAARLMVLMLLLVVSSITRAEDAYFDIAVSELDLKGALPPPPDTGNWRDWQKRAAMSPRVVVESGEGFVTMDSPDRGINAMGDGVSTSRIVLRAPAGKDVAGTLIVAKSDLSGMMLLPFSIPAKTANADAKKAYLHGVISYFNSQLSEGHAGAAYFRHRVSSAYAELGEKEAPENNWRRGRIDNLDDTLDLFTGTRAIAENLQLDRVVNVSKPGDDTVELSSIRGITVAEMDFKALLKDATPALDPLAKWIPADQHAVFFPSFESFQAVLNTGKELSTSAFTTLDNRTEDFGTKARYEKQLGLEMSSLAKIVGPAMVSSVAITGGDPYLEAGTDIAVIFESKDPTGLRALLQGKLTFSNVMQAKLETIDGLECAVFNDSSKGIRSYLTILDDAVVVTNSPAQIKALAAVKAKKSPSLAEADDYRFFRTRCVLGHKDESAFVILSDATIRRWCGPKWRIADSRRARALAKLLDDRCAKAAAIIKGVDQLEAVSEYGTASFLTPISELDIAKVSDEERLAYERWRQQYQMNWRGVFDPIAIRLTTTDQKLAADLSVMPLIAGTDYRQMIDLTQGVSIKPDSGDAHVALAHLIMAINAKSGLMRSADTFAMGFAPKAGVNPLGWVGPTISLYADDDPMWDELAKMKETGAEAYLKSKGYALPAAVFIESTSPLKLAAFMAAARGFVEQTAPNMTLWETKQHGEQSYVRVSASEAAKADMHDIDNVALFYATTGKGLVLSLNENTLIKALERLTAKKDDQPATTQPWAGESMAIQLSAGWIRAFETIVNDSFTTEVQRRAWSNLAILNEWKRLYPDQDPVSVHQKLFGSTLVSPGGGSYSWNETFQTMQSSVFGHPGEPKSADQKAELLKLFQSVNAGVTFEPQGLRGKVEIQR